MKKAVIYARYSSHKQREESIERQLEICHKFAEDNDYEVIAEYCDRGYKTAQGRDFGYCYIERILKNRKYIGIYSWSDIEKSDSIEAIIDERLFNKVQKRIEENANTGARENAVVDYVLSGKAFCGHCEQPLVADSVTKTIKNPKPVPEKNVLDFNLLTFDKISELLSEEPEPQPQAPANKKIYRYYVCRGRKEKAFLNGCHKNRLDKDKLENTVIEGRLRKRVKADEERNAETRA